MVTTANAIMYVYNQIYHLETFIKHPKEKVQSRNWRTFYFGNKKK
jgi:hypothetical protein